MVMLIRMPKPSGSWRFPIAIGVLFMLWSNLDQWFFLGPLFLALTQPGSSFAFSSCASLSLPTKRKTD